MSTSTSKSPSCPTAYEFTKRKRWPDLLVYELSDAITFVLSDNDAKIWFCSHTITELLAWSDAELIDRHFTELINSEDQRAFHVAFDESLRTRAEMNLFLRLKAKSTISPQNTPQSEVLFEVKGYPYFVENEIVARCFFVTAKPYPSRNVAMLNTFLELKVANERLQRQLVDLRVLDPLPSAPLSGPPISPVYPLVPSSLSLPSVPSAPPHPPDASSAFSSRRLSYDDFGSSAVQLQNPLYESLGPHAYGAQHLPASSARLTDEDAGDETSRRKKTRKSQNAEQYVCITCGRTDSPEWRKGPQGPKTLCNACGLRWAKEVRSNENATAGPSTSAPDA